MAALTRDLSLVQDEMLLFKDFISERVTSPRQDGQETAVAHSVDHALATSQATSIHSGSEPNYLEECIFDS